MLVKICGITRTEDALAALAAGAGALGFIFHPTSPRHVTPAHAARVLAETRAHADQVFLAVGVFVDAPLEDVRATMREAGLAFAQLHGDESPAYATTLGVPYIKAFRPRTREDLASAARFPRASYHLIDTYRADAHGGTGAVGNWEWAARLQAAHPTLLSGGLTPDNVAAAVAQVRPAGIDVSSGVESAPGVKDHAKIQRLFQALKETENVLFS